MMTGPSVTSRAADCTLVTMTMVVRVAETLKGPSAEPPTAPR